MGAVLKHLRKARKVPVGNFTTWPSEVVRTITPRAITKPKKLKRTRKGIGGILKGVGKVWQGAKKIKNPVKKIDKLVDDLDYVDTKKFKDDDIKLGPIWKKIKTGGKIAAGGTAATIGYNKIKQKLKKKKKDKEKD